MKYREIKTSPFIILGGGPAGCAAALSALRSGVDDIVIVEREPFGRHRIGEILLTQTIFEMKDLGVSKEMHDFGEFYGWGKKYAAAYVHGSDRTPWRVQNNNPIINDEEASHIPQEYINKENRLWYTFMVRRHEFDESLRELCKNRGIKILHGEVKKVHWANENSKEETNVSKIDIEVLDGGDIISLRPRFILDATGQRAVLPRSMNLRKKLNDWNFQSRYTYLKGVDYDTAMKHKFYHNGANILSHDDGWAWIANIGKGVSSVGVVSKFWGVGNNNLYKKLSTLPEAKIFGLDKATVVDYKGNDTNQNHFYAHHNYRFRSEKIRGENWACAGDSAMFLDPLLSQGVTLAMSLGAQAGNVAAKILNGEWSPVESLRKYEQMYVNEIELLNKIVSQWYEPDFSLSSSWSATARNISSMFGRDIGDDVESFRWISNLENFHNIVRYKNNDKFLQDLSNVNNVKSIHHFEDNEFIAI